MSDSVWHQLRTRAMLGTDRDRRPVTAAGPLGDAIAAIAGQTREGSAPDPAIVLLSEVALTSVYLRCGRLPVACAAPGAQPVLDDVSSPLSRQSCRHLEKILSDAPLRRLLPEWLSAVSHAQKRIPATLFPALLAAGQRDPTLRPAVKSVIGARGRWLATHNPAWQYAAREAPEPPAQGDTSAWEHATHVERVVMLEQLRLQDPVGARLLVERAFATERARERAGMLLTLRTGLGDADEPFLETCLDDRGKDVRRIAAELLGHIATSHLVARAIERASRWLHVSHATEGHIELRVTLPKSLDDAMLRDGVVELPARKRGKRAWWFEQVVAIVPPSHWSASAGVDAARWIAAANATEWEAVLVDAWASAADRHGDARWAEALLLHRPRHDVDLWRHLPRDRREQVFTSCLKTAVSAGDAVVMLGQAQRVEGPWSERFSKVLAHGIRAALRGEATYASAQLYEALRTCGCNMAPAVHEHVRGALAEELGDATWARVLGEMIELLGFRAAMLRELQT